MAYGLVRICTLIMLALAVSVTAACAEQAQPKNDCQTDEKSIQAAFDKMGIKNMKISEISKGPVSGLIEVVGDFQGRPVILYFDCAKRHLIQGKIIAIDTKKDLTGEKLQELMDKRKIDVSEIPLEEALVLGKKDAAKKVIVFTNPDCPHCVRFHGEMKRVVDKRKDIAFYIKILARPNDSKSQSIICAKSLKMLEDAYEKKTVQKKECDSKELENTGAVAGKLGISGTPTIVFPDGRMRSGAIAADEVIQLVDGKK